MRFSGDLSSGDWDDGAFIPDLPESNSRDFVDMAVKYMAESRVHPDSYTRNIPWWQFFSL